MRAKSQLRHKSESLSRLSADIGSYEGKRSPRTQAPSHSYTPGTNQIRFPLSHDHRAQSSDRMKRAFALLLEGLGDVEHARFCRSRRGCAVLMLALRTPFALSQAPPKRERQKLFHVAPSLRSAGVVLLPLCLDGSMGAGGEGRWQKVVLSFDYDSN